MWQHFLHRASHVREVESTACQKSELTLIRVLTKYNQGRTILPSLHKLSWRHAVPTDTSVLLLLSPSLQDLEMTISRLGLESTGGAFATPQRYGDYHDVDPVIVGLSAVAPSLARFSITGREGPGAAIIPHLTRLSHLRELYLFNQSIVLNADCLGSLLESLKNLEVLFARVANVSHSDTAVYTQSLQDLRLQGSSQDLCGVLSGFMDAPDLRSLQVKSVDGEYSQMDHYLFPLIASSTFARSLRRVSVVVLNDPSEIVWHDPNTMTSYATIIRPLLGLPDLEDVEICLANTVLSCGEDDIAEIARAWPRIRSLTLAYSPIGPRVRPPLASLQHFAEHCPELRRLSMTKLALLADVEVPSVPRFPPHPLSHLDLKMTFATWGENKANRHLDYVLAAQWVDYLFPNLVLSDPMPYKDASLITQHAKYHGWTAIERHILWIRSQRSAERNAVLEAADDPAA